jgi:hypothetical protein
VILSRSRIVYLKRAFQSQFPSRLPPVDTRDQISPKIAPTMDHKLCGGRIQAALIIWCLVILALAPHPAAACNGQFFLKGWQQNSNASDTDPTAWSYHFSGEDWKGTCATGRHQSPIAISTSQAKPTTMKGASLKFGLARDIIVINTGHSIQASVLFYTPFMLPPSLTLNHSSADRMGPLGSLQAAHSRPRDVGRQARSHRPAGIVS